MPRSVAVQQRAEHTTWGYGVEADIGWTPRATSSRPWGSYNPTEIQDPNLTVAPCAGGCTVTDPIRNGLVYVDGNPLPNAPEWIFNGIVTLQSDPVYKHFFGTLDWAYYSEKNFFLYESEEFRDDSLEFGLRLGYAFAQNKYELALFGRNILDEEIMQGGIDFNNLTAYTNTPRIIGMEFIACRAASHRVLTGRPSGRPAAAPIGAERSESEQWPITWWGPDCQRALTEADVGFGHELLLRDPQLGHQVARDALALTGWLPVVELHLELEEGAEPLHLVEVDPGLAVPVEGAPLVDHAARAERGVDTAAARPGR
jgi:hypothetical protein